jgi:hypothetical protein
MLHLFIQVRSVVDQNIEISAIPLHGLEESSDLAIIGLSTATGMPFPPAFVTSSVVSFIEPGSGVPPGDT